MKTVKDLDLDLVELVVVRCDFDVPIQSGHITEDIRIRANLETLRFLRQKGIKLFLISHLGRPQGRDPDLSLKIILPQLETFLSEEVVFQENLDKKEIGDIVLLENLRFWKEEESNDPLFAKKLASFGMAYVNECFSDSHRAHASIETITQFLPGYAGLNLEKEVTNLDKILASTDHPSVAIIGGAKIETKLPAITNLAKIVDKVLVGGKLMFEAKNANLPSNVILARDHFETKDIGSGAIKVFQEEIASARLIVWNGPMGLFEEEKYLAGTRAIAQAVVDSKAFSVIGGGDTISALDKLGLLSKINFTSMGGGAMLTLLAGKHLPGLAALGAYA